MLTKEQYNQLVNSMAEMDAFDLYMLALDAADLFIRKVGVQDKQYWIQRVNAAKAFVAQDEDREPRKS